eukprot:CAMPEP_0197051158 /NCGR_PEP_ID=MMETSP1384-20130603/25890_1 /TAXON_ID=29189 /ORGANISM="Ammonia sp." /LENGTH=166 /DNA_ID=CAMNT_0042483673 /DNA_START=328 /DNA_END=828 /DNA_ORIENTATION=-
MTTLKANNRSSINEDRGRTASKLIDSYVNHELGNDTLQVDMENTYQDSQPFNPSTYASRDREGMPKKNTVEMIQENIIKLAEATGTKLVTEQEIKFTKNLNVMKYETDSVMNQIVDEMKDDDEFSLDENGKRPKIGSMDYTRRLQRGAQSNHDMMNDIIDNIDNDA